MFPRNHHGFGATEPRLRDRLKIRDAPSCRSFSGSRISRWILALILACPCCTVSVAQDNAAPAQQPSPQSSSRPAAPVDPPPITPGEKSEQEKEIERQEQAQRVLGVLPLFGVTDRQNASPLTGREKFHLFLKSAFDPATIGIVGLQAALSQAENEFPAYGQGAQGFGKRFGASLADEVSSGFWSNYAYPVLLKEDPRYFRLGEGNLTTRIFYGIKQEFVCHKDRGGRRFNFSNILGALTSGAISNLYYPGRTEVRVIPATATSPAIPVYEDDRGVELTLSRTAIAIGYDTAGGLFAEFWPDIHRKIFNRRRADPVASQ